MRIHILGSIVALVGVATSVSVARADSEEPLLPVVITATRIPTPEAQVASSITVVTADQISASQAPTLPDVLNYVPGLNLVQSGGPGGLTSVFMRGTNSNHTKVLVDGIDVSDPSNPNATFDYGQFLTQDIERVEVLRGPQSGLYGSDAIGGVINIITRNGEGPAQFSGMVEGGSFQTFNQAAGVRGSDEQFHYAANVEHIHAGSTPVTPLDLLAPGEGRNNDYYDNLTASTKLGFDVNSHLDLGFVGRYTDTHLHFTAEDFLANGDFPSAQQSETDTTGIYSRAFEHLALADGWFDETFGVAYTRNKSTNLTPGSTAAINTGERIKADLQGAFRFTDSQILLLGVEHAHDKISEPISVGLSIDSGYAELQSRFDERLFSAINIRYDSNDRFGSKVTYRIAPTYLIPETGTQFRASVGTGFKAPTLSELFQNFPPFFFGNPNLRPETSVGYDVGVEQALLADSLRVGATYFHIRLRDLINTDVTGSTYANVDRATTLGVESFISYRPWSALNLRLDYTYTEATDDVLQQELLRRPKSKATLAANWQTTSLLSLHADVLYVGTWIDANRDFSVPRLEAPGYLTFNVAGNYDLTKQIAVFARIDNLLDRHYEQPVGFLRPSFGVFGGIKAKF